MNAHSPVSEAAVVPFEINISDAQIADLKERLTMARWPDSVADDWSHGQPVHFVRELAERWLTEYDWRKHEAALNRYPQFTTVIDGQVIHFLHVKSDRPNAFPLILTHGWPSTFTEYLALIEPLTNPADGGQAFDVVLPSLPGYGFSSPMTAKGWDTARTAKAWDVLMKRLDYARYGYVGNDVGSLVGKEIGALAPEGLVGVHVQQIFSFPEDPSEWGTKLDDFEREGMANADAWEANNGYQRIQQTRPATLGYGLVDSPVAQLAWNAELTFGFDGSGASYLDRDRYLTDVSIYWFTRTGGSAANIYHEDFKSGAGDDKKHNPTPTGVAVFPWDFRSVRAFAEKNNNIVHWSQMERGSHFAAVDAPDLLATDVRKFFSALI